VDSVVDRLAPDFGAGAPFAPGTRTPAPHPLQRIFLPASSGLVANFRPHTGQANLRAGGDEFSAPRVSLGGGTVAVAPHPLQATLCPICDHATLLASPHDRHVNGRFIGEGASEVKTEVEAHDAAVVGSDRAIDLPTTALPEPAGRALRVAEKSLFRTELRWNRAACPWRPGGREQTKAVVITPS
jgi:hypothetical protein